MSVAMMPLNPLLSETELDYLRIIKNNAGITAPELEKIVNVSRTTVSRRLASLLGKGYVERRTHEGKVYHYYVKKGVLE